MKGFTRQWIEPELKFSIILLILISYASVVIGIVFGATLHSWIVAVASAVGAFLSLVTGLYVVYWGTRRSVDSPSWRNVSPGSPSGVSSVVDILGVGLSVSVFFLHARSTPSSWSFKWLSAILQDTSGTAATVSESNQSGKFHHRSTSIYRGRRRSIHLQR